MKTKVIDGQLFKLITVDDSLVTNEEFFKDAFEQIIRDYAMILDVEEMKKFSSEVIDSHF